MEYIFEHVLFRNIIACRDADVPSRTSASTVSISAQATDTSEVHTLYGYKVLSIYETRMFLNSRAKLLRLFLLDIIA